MVGLFLMDGSASPFTQMYNKNEYVAALLRFFAKKGAKNS